MTDPTILPASGAPFDLDASERGASLAADRLCKANTAEEAALAVLEWDRVMGEQQTWSLAQSIRFRQDTTDPTAKAAKAHIDEAAPRLEGTRRTFLEALFSDAVTPERRAALTTRFGATCMERWQCELRSFHPAMGELLKEEQRLQSRQTALVGSARVLFQGEERTLPYLGGFVSSSDRAVRRAAAAAKWSWYEGARDELDEIFDELVFVRTRLAKELGRNSFSEVAYDRMRRTDYGPGDVARMRSGVLEHLVPLATEIRAGQATALGLTDFAIYDETVYGSGETPRPGGPPGVDGARWLEERAAKAFRDLDGTGGTRIGELFETMHAKGLMDLAGRSGKGPGGFCSFLPSVGLPFIFANFNGSSGDVRVFTHEMGHAYQGWSASQRVELTDQRRCTAESAEIHSMSLEFLTWPVMEPFFGSAANRFRKEHLATQITFIPYGCAIDHFQAEVYGSPSMSAAERRGVWKELEAQYLPWRRWDGMRHGEEGSAWQAQLHVFQYPFYYIDYCLAQLVAFQFLELSERDAPDAWRRYQKLCDLGGSHGFRELVRIDAEMLDPFDEGVLQTVTDRLRARL